MVNRTISLPFELNELLRTEKDASSLIKTLLLKHYATTGATRTEVILLKEKLAREKAEFEEKIRKQEEELSKVENTIKVGEMQRVANIENGLTPTAKLIRREFYKLTDREITDEETAEFLKISEDEKVMKIPNERRTTIQDFAKGRR